MTGSVDKAGAVRLGDLAERIGAKLKGDPDVEIVGVGPLREALPSQLSFLADGRHLPELMESRAAAFIVPPPFENIDRNLLVCANPYLAMALAAQRFAEPPHLPAGIDGSARVGEGCDLAPGVSVGPLALVGSGCRIGKGTRIYGGAVVGSDVQIGEDCLVYPRAVIQNGCRIGNGVIIHSGAVIGSDGFGFAPDERGRHVKIPQMGIVQIDDDVEIGANSTIDRATFGKTWIQRGTKIDNLVMIGHNVVVGEDSILVAQVGISGSTRVGSHVVLAGQVGISGHLEIGDGVRIGAKSGVHASIPAGDVSGIPAMPHKEWTKAMAVVRRLPQLREELRGLRAKVRELEDALRGE